MKIGVAGTGRMGAAMAQRLLSVGHEVSVWNRSAEKTQTLAEVGAKVAASARELASACEIVISTLTDAAAIEGVYAGERGLLAADVKGRLFIEMSTVRPVVEQELAQKVKAQGAALVDCPVGGSTGPAREGKLIGFAGGDAADVARAKPVLDQLCRRLEHVGPVGAGARMKLAINLPLLVYWQALGEALRLIEPLNLDPARVVDILSDTSGGPNVLKARGPSIAAALQGRDTGAVTFDVDSIRKDLRTMIEEGRALGADLPVSARALACFDEASEDGLGPKDGATLPARVAKR
ncbi:MAG TPA: NAD(P)-dependent oxidoreductase [Burkholderiales bacterium]|nr:NAD(P)-dependent oxidoreductase [Burkholderiales bacterium]